MYEKDMLLCPDCGHEAPRQLHDRNRFACPACHSRFKVIDDDETGRPALIDDHLSDLPEPLGLPRGSVRAIVSLATALACWLLVLVGQDVPAYLLSLLLTIIGYYFGFRADARMPEGQIYTQASQRPLFVPRGGIRRFLIAGLVVAGIVLLIRGRMADVKYLQFFLILTGLVAGYAFARVFALIDTRAIHIMSAHAKGLAVLAVTAWLLVLLATGACTDTVGSEALTPIMLCAVISFYFGSRT
jgi:hypothetical protein